MRPRLLIAALLTATPLVARDAPALAGRLEGTTYYSATGNFSVVVPVLPELGGRITDTPNVVTFDDPFSTHISIACFALDATQRWELDTRGLKDYLAYFFINFVMPEFSGRYPGSTVQEMRFLPQEHEGVLVVFALLPGGSFFASRNSVFDQQGAPVVAKRGNLVFVRQGHAYVITTELAERVTQPSTFRKTDVEENELLQKRLLDLTGRMMFTAPRNGARPAPGRG